LPKFKTSLPYKLNPNFTKELKEKCSSECYEFSNFKGRSYDAINNVGYFAAFFYPDCDEFQLEVLVKLFNFIFILDDHTEYDWGDVGRNADKAYLIWKQFDNMFDKFLGEKYANNKMIDWKPYIVGYYCTFDAIFETFNEDQKFRCIKLWKDYIEGNIEESKFYNNCAEIKDIQTIINVSTFDTDCLRF